MKKQSNSRPPIWMIDTEAEMLSDLAMSVEERLPQVATLLLDEISRATTTSSAKIPSDVVTMNAAVEFIDEASDTTRTVTLVFPRDADISAGRVSILTPVGAGLIGLRRGQSILWPDREGKKRKLTIVNVVQANPDS